MLINKHDAILRQDALGAFKRYPSLFHAGLSVEDFPMNNTELAYCVKLTNEWKDKFIRLLSSRFRVPAMVRAESGSFLNIDEAMDGVSECFRRPRLHNKAPLRIGINMSRDHSSARLTSLRGGAVLALLALCNKRQQKVSVEIAYGNGEAFMRCHVRVGLPQVNEELITKINCAPDGIYAIGANLIEFNHARQKASHKGIGLVDDWYGHYRFNRFPWTETNPEYDFVLDRIETSNEKEEYERVLNALKRFGVAE